MSLGALTTEQGPEVLLMMIAMTTAELTIAAGLMWTAVGHRLMTGDMMTGMTTEEV